MAMVAAAAAAIIKMTKPIALVAILAPIAGSALIATMAAPAAAAAPAAPIAAFPAGLDPNSLLLPPPTADGRVRVSVALHVLNLASIDEVTERFQLTGYLLAQWNDSRLTYQPAGPRDGYRTLALDAVWRPMLVIINVVEPRQTHETSMRVTPDGTLYYAERFDARVTSTFHLKPFPFDRQKLEVLIHPFTDQLQYIDFVPSSLPVWTAAEFSSYSSLESWKFKSLTYELERAPSQYGKHAVAEAKFEIAVDRRYGFYLWKVFLPLLLMVIVSWSVFWFDPPEVSSQVTIAVTSILTIIAFALAISLTLPRVPYLTFADAFFLTCYVFAFVAMLEVTAVHVAYRADRRKTAATIRRTARRLVPAAFVLVNTIILPSGAKTPVCMPPTTSGAGELIWNSKVWAATATSCTATGGECGGSQQCLDTTVVGNGQKPCTASSANCSCYNPQACSAALGTNDGCSVPDSCLNSDGVPDGGSDNGNTVDCSATTCYCSPQGIYSGTCGPTNANWLTAAAYPGVGKSSGAGFEKPFKYACPTSYAYQFDDASSDWTCQNTADQVVNYKVVFCPEL